RASWEEPSRRPPWERPRERRHGRPGRANAERRNDGDRNDGDQNDGDQNNGDQNDGIPRTEETQTAADTSGTAAFLLAVWGSVVQLVADCLDKKRRKIQHEWRRHSTRFPHEPLAEDLSGLVNAAPARNGASLRAHDPVLGYAGLEVQHPLGLIVVARITRRF